MRRDGGTNRYPSMSALESFADSEDIEFRGQKLDIVKLDSSFRVASVVSINQS